MDIKKFIKIFFAICGTLILSAIGSGMGIPGEAGH